MKGDNLRIEEAKNDLISFINKNLQSLPIGVIKMLLESTLIEVTALYNKTVERENSEYEDAIQKKTDNKEE